MTVSIKEQTKRYKRAKVTAELNAFRQFAQGFMLDNGDSLREDIRPIDIVCALLPDRAITGEDYLQAVSNQNDTELQAAIQLAKVWQDMRQAARKLYQYTDRNNPMVVRFKMLLDIAPKSRK
jgi:homoserine trans-succinylase